MNNRPHITIASMYHGSKALHEKIGQISKETDIPPEWVDQFNLVTRNQFNIAKIIEKNPDSPVIVENSPTFEHGENPELDAKAQKLFPSGKMPSSFDKLNFAQKQFLLLQLAGHTQVHLKVIPQIFSDDMWYVNMRETPELIAYSRREPNKLVLMREYSALQNSRDLAITENKTVTLIYGAMHPFTNVVTCFPDVALDFHRNLQDTSHIGQQTVAYRHSLAKLPFNCNEAAKIFDNLQIAGNGIKKISSQPNGVFSAVSSVTAAGVLLFGLFKCCKSRKNNPVIKTEAPIVNKHNKYSNHKKR